MKRIFYYCLCLILLSLLFTCVKLEKRDKDLIYGGEVVGDDEFYPFLVSSDSSAGPCGGTILNEKFILTAAHCHQNAEVTIRAGSNYKDECKHPECQVTKVYSCASENHHPNLYGACLHFDFRILRLPNGKELKFNSRVDSAVIEKEFGPKVGSELMSVGWGLINEQSTSKVLLKTTENVEDLESCPYKASQIACAANYTSGQFCTSSKTSITCSGDSGGPVFYKSSKIVTGVISTNTFGGEKTCSIQEGQKNIYGSIGQVRKWIIETSRQDSLFAWGYSPNLFWNNFAFSNMVTNLIPSLNVAPILRLIKPAHGPFVLAISVSDFAYSWGKGSNYELGYGDANDVIHPDVNVRLSIQNVKDMCGGISHSLALTTSGDVYEWGTYLGQPSIKSPSLIKFPNNVPIASISCGYYHNLAVSTTNQIYFWGSNENGEGGDIENCQIDGSRFYPNPILIQAISDKSIYSICAGKSTSFAVSTDGMLFSWGKNNEGQLGTNYKSSCIGKPEQVPLQESASIVYCGIDFHFVKAGKEVYGWGRNLNRLISNSELEYISQPEKTDIGEIDQMTTGESFVIFRTTNMTWYGRGNNNYGQLGIRTSVTTSRQAEIVSLNNLSKQAIVRCRNYYCFASGTSRTTTAFLVTFLICLVYFTI